MLDEKPLGQAFDAIIEHLEANKEMMSDDLRRFYRSIAKCSMMFDRKQPPFSSAEAKACQVKLDKYIVYFCSNRCIGVKSDNVFIIALLTFRENLKFEYSLDFSDSLRPTLEVYLPLISQAFDLQKKRIQELENHSASQAFAILREQLSFLSILQAFGQSHPKKLIEIITSLEGCLLHLDPSEASVAECRLALDKARALKDC